MKFAAADALRKSLRAKLRAKTNRAGIQGSNPRPILLATNF
jgi:hypothetical protein